MDAIDDWEANSLVENHLISRDLVARKRLGAALINDDKSISVMINEEDHLREQCIIKGLQLRRAYDRLSEIDSKIGRSIKFAYDERLGYLTACPTNLGTGLRASVMLFLPAITINDSLREVVKYISRLGLTVRGMYGEGTKASASMYQVSNQITLGISEKNAIDNLKIITAQLIDKERKARNGLNKIKLEDMCFRALGTLQNSRILSSKEMMDLLSRIKLGISMGIIKTDVLPIKLFIEGQPNMLMKKYGQLEPEERDIYRAAFIRDALK